MIEGVVDRELERERRDEALDLARRALRGVRVYALDDAAARRAAQVYKGDLTDEERAEYEGYVRANKFIGILQREARRILGAKS